MNTVATNLLEQINGYERKQREIITLAVVENRPLTKDEVLQYSELAKGMNILHSKLDLKIRAAVLAPQADTAPHREYAPSHDVEMQRAKFAAARAARQKKRRQTRATIYILIAVALVLGVITWAYIDSYRRTTHTPERIYITEPQATGGTGNGIVY